ncbi:gamma-glutamylcyclotransferase [Adhaeribacter radiodurans]|uniref:Gamma-glutamylcyclotransferase n=2 Tax=Adhaeribacter radiodurans TaxID=2745197 RepID=A0A7L7LGQ4_9BACT|nr:gamma-glutamylcyclotransferase [Adhaeribacter radiodurans]
MEDLNKKKDIVGNIVNNLDNSGLSEVEKAFIQIYKPENYLIVYGTLAPGASNHSVVKHIQGKWEEGVVRGKLEKLGWGAEMGFYGFKHTTREEQEIIKAYVLCSDELVNNWYNLDAFEGNEYRRILARYELDNGETGVGYIYAVNEEKL